MGRQQDVLVRQLAAGDRDDGVVRGDVAQELTAEAFWINKEAKKGKSGGNPMAVSLKEEVSMTLIFLWLLALPSHPVLW